MRSWLLTLLLLPLLAACGGTHEPSVRDARIVLPPPGMQMAAGYFVLENPGKVDLEIVEARSPAFAHVEVHETVIRDGISRMREVDSPTVPARGERGFEPGGWHLMLMGYNEDPASAESWPVTIVLEDKNGTRREIRAAFIVEQVGGAAG